MKKVASETSSPAEELLAGNLLVRCSDPQVVQRALEASDRDRENIETALNAVRVLFLCGEFEQAAVYVQRALAQNALSPEAQLRYGQILHMLGDAKTAISVLNTALLLAPTSLEAHTALFDVLLAEEEYPLAHQVMAQAKSNCGDSLELLTRESALCTMEGAWADAMRICASITELLPDSPRAWLNLGQLQSMNGLLEEAESSLWTAKVLGPDLWECDFLIANLYEACGLTDQAEQSLRASILIDDTHWETLNNLALLLMSDTEEESLQEAQTLIAKALRLAPAEPTILLNQVLLARKRNERTKAWEALVSLKALPSLPDALIPQIQQLHDELYADSDPHD